MPCLSLLVKNEQKNKRYGPSSRRKLWSLNTSGHHACTVDSSTQRLLHLGFDTSYTRSTPAASQPSKNIPRARAASGFPPTSQNSMDRSAFRPLSTCAWHVVMAQSANEGADNKRLLQRAIPRIGEFSKSLYHCTIWWYVLFEDE